MEELPKPGEQRHRLLMMLDELPAIGRIPAIENAMPVCAGYGIKIFTIIQEIGQLERVYGRNSTLFGESHVRLAFAPNDHETALLLSKLAGRTTAHVATRSTSHRGALGRATDGQAEQQVGRDLLTPDDCMRLAPTRVEERKGQSVVLDPGQELAFVGGMPPILATKVQHYDDPQFLAASKLPPAAISTPPLAVSEASEPVPLPPILSPDNPARRADPTPLGRGRQATESSPTPEYFAESNALTDMYNERGELLESVDASEDSGCPGDFVADAPLEP